MRLVYDEEVVLRQCRAAVQGVDREQRVVGHDEVGLPGPVAGQLDEALRAVRAVGRAEALPYRDRHLRPGHRGVCRSVVTVGESTALGLLLGPLAKCQNLGAEHRVGCRIDRAQRRGELACSDQPGLRVLPDSFADAMQARVVRASLQQGRLGASPGDRLDGVNDHRYVFGRELRLQRQRGRGHHHPRRRRVEDVRESRSEVAEGLARPRTGLHEHVLT